MLTIKLDKKRNGTYWKYSCDILGEKYFIVIDTRCSQAEHEHWLNYEINKIISNLKYTLEITTDENRWDK